eukprot:27543-Chlamydomonas_euryale.AAC.7
MSRWLSSQWAFVGSPTHVLGPSILAGLLAGCPAIQLCGSRRQASRISGVYRGASPGEARNERLLSLQRRGARAAASELRRSDAHVAPCAGSIRGPARDEHACDRALTSAGSIRPRRAGRLRTDCREQTANRLSLAVSNFGGWPSRAPARSPCPGECLSGDY